MNYLAHLFLSEPTEDAWLGSLMGDFVKGPLDGRYGIKVTRAIALHRRIDTFTDAHPLVLRSKARVSADRRRYAGIMIDMFYDHFLARHWQDYHHEPLDTFTARFYELLLRNHPLLPARLQHVAPFMAQHDWLGSYAELDNVRIALDRMGKRLKRENHLLGSADELLDNYDALETDFRDFLPEVSRFALDMSHEV
jgi:acyl carrier protein phosphodiesterase